MLQMLQKSQIIQLQQPVLVPAVSSQRDCFACHVGTDTKCFTAKVAQKTSTKLPNQYRTNVSIKQVIVWFEDGMERDRIMRLRAITVYRPSI